MIKLKKQGIFNLIIFALEYIGFIMAFVINGIGIMGYYTQESNFLLMIACGIYAWYALVKKVEVMPGWVAVLRYTATCLVTVTFVVVVFGFVPMCLPNVEAALYMVFKEANFFHHFTCPILAVVSYLFVENDKVPDLKDTFTAAFPTFLYAVVTTALNIAKVIEGPYPFLYVYRQPVILSVTWFIVIPCGGFIFAVFIRELRKKRVLVKKIETEKMEERQEAKIE